MGDLSDHFSRHEFACKDQCGFDTVDVELIPVMEQARKFIGPFTPNSACRCVAHNEIVQQQANSNYKRLTSRSKHLQGRAVDIPCKDPQGLYDYLDRLYPDKYGIGRYSWGVHVDTRARKARWFK